VVDKTGKCFRGALCVCVWEMLILTAVYVVLVGLKSSKIRTPFTPAHFALSAHLWKVVRYSLPILLKIFVSFRTVKRPLRSFRKKIKTQRLHVMGLQILRWQRSVFVGLAG